MSQAAMPDNLVSVEQALALLPVRKSRRLPTTTSIGHCIEAV
jgi:hypothetical protein